MFDLFRRPAATRPARRTRPTFEVLEARTVPALGVGPPVMVNAPIRGAFNELSVNDSNRAGQSVTAWVRATSTASGQARELLAQRFDASGQKVGGEVLVTRAVVGNDFAVGVDGRGNFVVAWTQAIAGRSTNVFAQRFAVTGARVGGPLTVAGAPGAEQLPKVAMDARGNFLVTYQSRYLGSASTPERPRFQADLYGVRYRADGAVIKPFVIAAHEGDGGNYIGRSDVDMAPDGRFTVAYTRVRQAARPADNTGSLLVHNYDAQAVLRARDTIFANVRGAFTVAVGVDDRANAAVAWGGVEAGSGPTGAPAGRGVYAVRVNATGGHSGGITIATTRAPLLHDVALDRAGGGFVVAWGQQGDAAAVTTRSVQLAAVAPASRTVTARRSLGGDSTTNLRDASLSARGAGQFVITYTMARRSQNVEPSNIFARFGTF